MPKWKIVTRYPIEVVESGSFPGKRRLIRPVALNRIKLPLLKDCIVSVAYLPYDQIPKRVPGKMFGAGSFNLAIRPDLTIDDFDVEIIDG